MGEHTWICISREYGSDGLEIGKRLACKLSLPCYDKELLSSGIKLTNIDKDLSDKGLAKVANRWLYENMSYDSETPYVGKSPQEILRYGLEEGILNYAEKGDGIFIGRSSELVLMKNFERKPLRIFITAPYEYRLATVIRRDIISFEEAEKKIESIDKLRREYYEFCKEDEHAFWGNSQNYDAVFNSQSLMLYTIVDSIAAMYYDRKEQEDI